MAKYKPIKKGKPLKRKRMQGPPAPKKKQGKLKSALSELKLRAQARKGARAGRKAVKGMGPNVGIGVSGESPKAHAKAVRKTQRKRKVAAAGKKVKSAISELSQRGRRKKIGASKGTKVRKGAAGVQKTKGGEYVKYAKGSKSSKGFKSAFKSGCAGGKKSFSWDGRSYSCKKK